MKDLKYWKGRCVDARLAAKYATGQHKQEFMTAYKFAQRRVEQLERQVSIRKVVS